MTGSDRILQTLKQYWGYESFRPHQEDIILSAIQGRDTLGILPTGGGKSVCFQLPTLLSDGLAIVVTPLIALMKDQVENLRERGIKALAIHAGMTRREVDTALNNCAYGDFKFLYMSPERLRTELFRSYLPLLNVSYIVVDEAHCISQWGYDFRPDYLQIAQLRHSLEGVSVIALTATATREVAEDIMDKLEFTDRNIVQGSFARENLVYSCVETVDKRGMLLRSCLGTAGSGIVYVRSRNLTQELARFLQANGVEASFYHAGLSSRERAERQAGWIQGKVRVMVCTNAFGMGIDKPDVRFVLHFGLPDSIEAYFQEAGRAGRDGRHSDAVLLWNADDCARLRQMNSLSYPSLEYIEGIYHKIHAFFGIAYERGEGKELRLDMGKFCSEFKLNAAQAYYAIRYIGRCGHWTFAEDIDVPTRVQITVDSTSLYSIEFPYAEMRSVLDTLMRRYEGLFSFPVTIDEGWVAARSGISVTQLRQTLYQLSLMRVVRYIPCVTSDVIYLHHNRLYPKNVNLQPSLYGLLTKASTERMEAMIGYVQNSGVCRSVQLLAYFGEKNGVPCGRCDVCSGENGAVFDYKSRASDLREQMERGERGPVEI